VVSFAVSHAAAIATAWGEGRQMAGLGRVDENFLQRDLRRAKSIVL